MPSTDKRKEDKKGSIPSVLTGVYMFPNGDKYDGEYTQSADGVLERNGMGEHATKNGVTYKGNWKDDKMNGFGRLEHPSGAVYEGEFINNQFHGAGKYTWANGSSYVGSFQENRLEGQGQFADTDTQTWTGTFRYKAAPALRFKLNL